MSLKVVSGRPNSFCDVKNLYFIYLEMKIMMSHKMKLFYRNFLSENFKIDEKKLCSKCVISNRYFRSLTFINVH